MAKKAKKAAKKAAPRAKKATARAKRPSGPKAIPDGYPRLMAYTIVNDAGAAIAFFKDVFGAKERMRMPTPDGKIAHAEVEFGDSVLMLADDIMGGGTR